MTNRFFLAVIALCFSIYGFSKEMNIDFSKTSQTFTPFNGASFQLKPDPNNPLNQVGELINAGQDNWEGAFYSLLTPVSLDSVRVIELDAYVTSATGQVVLFKFEDGTQANIELTDTITQTGWQTLRFDFNFAKLNYLDQNTFQASGEYSKVVVFLNGGSLYAGSILLDNIRGGVQGNPYSLDIVYNDLVWHDEFNVDGAVNSENWFHQTKLPAGGSWFNGEQQHYTDRIENSFIQGGFLNIVAKKETFTDQGHTKNYTSARLNSKYAFTYGRVDCRAKLPSGAGTWPAIWTLGRNITEDGGFFANDFGTTPWPACGEIDIMEHWGNTPNKIHGSLHTTSSSGATQNTGSIYVPNVSDSFNVYSMNWSPQQIAFMVNDEIFYVYNPSQKNPSTWPFNEPQYFLLNIAMGGVGGSIDPNFTESAMVIDYIRVYQNVNTAIKPNDEKPLLNFYPNPATSQLNLIGEVDLLSIIDFTGKVVGIFNKPLNAIDISYLPSGIYTVQMKSDEALSTQKLIIKN